MSLEDHRRRERAQTIGLLRYQLICPAIDEELSTKQRGKLVRAGYGASALVGSRRWCPHRACCRPAPMPRCPVPSRAWCGTHQPSVWITLLRSRRGPGRKSVPTVWATGISEA
jgi:hypothetical protein